MNTAPAASCPAGRVQMKSRQTLAYGPRGWRTGRFGPSLLFCARCGRSILRHHYSEAEIRLGDIEGLDGWVSAGPFLASNWVSGHSV